jgi:hypothetical protein
MQDMLGDARMSHGNACESQDRRFEADPERRTTMQTVEYQDDVKILPLPYPPMNPFFILCACNAREL